MHHILAAYLAAPPPPGVFKIMGHAIPTDVGVGFHWIAKSFILIALVLILLLLKFREGTPLWQLVVAMALGAFALPHTFTWIAKTAVTINKGGTIASTGAPIGLVLIMAAILAGVFFVPTVFRRKTARATRQAAQAAAAAQAEEEEGSGKK